jgi:hypothetical protein
LPRHLPIQTLLSKDWSNTTLQATNGQILPLFLQPQVAIWWAGRQPLLPILVKPVFWYSLAAVTRTLKCSIRMHRRWSTRRRLPCMMLKRKHGTSKLPQAQSLHLNNFSAQWEAHRYKTLSRCKNDGFAISAIHLTNPGNPVSSSVALRTIPSTRSIQTMMGI